MTAQIATVLDAYARANEAAQKHGISLNQARELTAQKAGYPNWNRYINALREQAFRDQAAGAQ